MMPDGPVGSLRCKSRIQGSLERGKMSQSTQQRARHQSRLIANGDVARRIAANVAKLPGGARTYRSDVLERRSHLPTVARRAPPSHLNQ
jgi:hypothetical protein